MGLLQVDKKISQDSVEIDSFDTCNSFPRSIHQHAYVTPAYTGYIHIHVLHQHTWLEAHLPSASAQNYKGSKSSHLCKCKLNLAHTFVQRRQHINRINSKLQSQCPLRQLDIQMLSLKVKWDLFIIPASATQNEAWNVQLRGILGSCYMYSLAKQPRFLYSKPIFSNGRG